MPDLYAVPNMLDLARVVASDVRWYLHQLPMLPNLDRKFIVLVRRHEMDEFKSCLLTNIHPHVVIAEAELGIPSYANYNLYVTDLLALGLSEELLRNEDLMNSHARFADKVTYISGKNNGTLPV